MMTTTTNDGHDGNDNGKCNGKTVALMAMLQPCHTCIIHIYIHTYIHTYLNVRTNMFLYISLYIVYIPLYIS